MSLPARKPIRMPKVTANHIEQYYEIYGQGPTLVLVHGGFVDSRMWQPQVEHFQQHFKVLRYDLRGHGQSGPSERSRYSIGLLAEDLLALLDALGIEQFTLCGLSLGGMIAQQFAVRHSERLRALVLADTAVSTSLTLSDWLQRYLFFPKWLLLLTLRMMGSRQFVRFSFWLARVTRSEAWIGQDEAVREYLHATMLKMEPAEYRKVYAAIYDFSLQPLERIGCPTLVLLGEHESKSVYRHAEEIVRRVPLSELQLIPDAGHTSNLEKPEAFNKAVADFLRRAVA